MKTLISFGIYGCALLWGLTAAWATDLLPYAVRTHPYNGFSTTAAGDIRTVGMSEASVGLADTFLAAANNPAGLAMTLNIGDTSLTKNNVHDGFVQNYDEVISTSFLGAALSAYPWGFSLGIVPMGQEGQSYFLPLSVSAPFAGQPADLSDRSREYRLAVSRVFFDDHLSLGVSLNFGIAEEEISATQFGFDDDRHSFALGATLGGFYQLPDRFLLGVSYTLPMHYDFDTSTSAALPGFFQPMDVPTRLTFALGWIPSRFVRGAFGVTWIGKTDGAALLSNDLTPVGGSVTLQPKAGLAYVFMDYRNFQGTLFGGAYFETARIAGTYDRIHKTAGVEAKAWVFTAGLGLDTADQYKNFIYSVGIDLGGVLQYLYLVPRPSHPAYKGMFSTPFANSDEGLARPLVKNWRPHGPDMDPIKIIENLPEKASKEAEKIENNPKELIHPGQN